MRSLGVLMVVLVLLVLSGCGVVDPARPTAQPDAEVFGNLLDVERSPDDPDSWIVKVKVGAPRSVRAADEDSGKPTPLVEKTLEATVTVGTDSVVLIDDRPGRLDDIDSGTEIVILPVLGTSEMYGSNDLRLEASMVMDFVTYHRWRLPKLDPESDIEVTDPAIINSAGYRSLAGRCCISHPVFVPLRQKKIRGTALSVKVLPRLSQVLPLSSGASVRSFQRKGGRGLSW